MTTATTFSLPEKPTHSLSEFKLLHDPSDKTAKLGSGSFATVKLARETKSKKQFALKMVNVSSKASTSDLMNLKAEFSIHQKLHHDNVIKLYGHIQQDAYVYLVLEYAEHGNLYNHIHKSKRLAERDVFKFFYQTCLAVDYLHKNDVMHRDIKPENVLLDKNNNIKLCDFGWATRTITKKRTTFCGTYEYMAPEIVHKTPYDYRVDIWSLGILLFELFHREAPYKGRSLPEITKSLSRKTFSVSGSVNPSAGNLIHKILKVDPSERPSIEEIFEHPWVRSHLANYRANVEISRSTTSMDQDSKTLRLRTVDETASQNTLITKNATDIKAAEDRAQDISLKKLVSSLSELPLSKPTSSNPDTNRIDVAQANANITTDILSQPNSQEITNHSSNDKILARVSPLRINTQTSLEYSSMGSLDKICSSGNYTTRKLEISRSKNFLSFSDTKCFPSTTTNSKRTLAAPEENVSSQNSLLSPNVQQKLTDVVNELTQNANASSPSFTSVYRGKATNKFVKVSSPKSNQFLGRDDSKNNLTSSVSGESTGPTTPLNANFQAQKKTLGSFKVSSKVELPKIRDMIARKVESINPKYTKVFKNLCLKNAGLTPKH